MNAVRGLFLVGALELALAGIVWARGPRRAVNRWFAAIATALAFWSMLVALRRVLPDPVLVLIVLRVLFAVAVMIPLSFFRFSAVFPEATRPGSTLSRATMVAGVFISGLSFSPLIVSGVRRVDADYLQPVYGPLYPAFALYFLACFASGLTILSLKLRNARGSARAQLHYVLIGTALAATGGMITSLVVPLVIRSSRVSVWGPYFPLIWVAFVAHSIVRHRLMDIRVVITRSAAYTVTWAVVSGGLVVGAVMLDLITPLSPTLSPGGAILLGLAASLCFTALTPNVQRLADRYLYRPGPNARLVIREGTRLMATLGDPDRVTAAMADLLRATLRLESLSIVVRDPEREMFRPAATRHADPTVGWSPAPLGGSSPVVAELRDTPGSLLADELAFRLPVHRQYAIAAELTACRAEAAVPVRREGELIAIMLAGPKLSGDPYFRDDLDLLDTMANQLAIGLKNAELYQEIVSIKEYNERILARMDSGVVAVREDRVVTTFNPAAERITGLPAERVLAQSVEALDGALRQILALSLTGQPDAETEINITQPDGRVLPLLTHTSALHDATGQIRGAIAVFNDHSRLKALEEDKRRADRLAAMGALATGIAHEIRNPLVAIKTFAELLPARADDHEFRSTFAKVASKEVHRIEELLGRLRALAAPQVSALGPLDVASPIEDTLDLLRGEADRRQVRVVSEIEPELPQVLGEPDQLKQLFLNLFLNAFEAMANGGTLSVTARADRSPRGGRTGKAATRFITVRVTDTGPGIPHEDLPKIFEPFFTTKVQGTGLGLAICRGIADAHRARLWAETGPAGVGTAFVVQFPALTTAPLAEAVR